MKLGYLLLAVFVCMALPACCAPDPGAAAKTAEGDKIPVIFDTDICDDIDDLFALLCCVRHPRLELKAVTVVHADVMSKARYVRKVLDIAGARDVPIGVGKPISRARLLKNQYHPHTDAGTGYDRFAADMPLGTYPGALEVMRQVLDASEEPVAVICAGAMTNSAELAVEYPALAHKVRGFFVMGGEVVYMRPEHNVMCDPEASEVVFNCGLPVFVAPYTPAEKLLLRRERLRAVFADMTDPVHRVIRESVELWWGQDPLLYDIAPVFYLTDPELFDTRPCALHTELEGRLTRGFTVPDYNASVKNCLVADDLKADLLLDKCLDLLKRAKN
ncbi:MAG: nucleoside hydrolase [Abditibacteriota bacterium]|nr:nucleoside hydrolase [Abditibacteriota bacterium]